MSANSGRRKALARLAGYGVGLLLAGWVNGSRAQSSATKVVDLKIEKGALAGTLTGNVIRVTQGDHLTINWTTDEAVELHLHGYDIEVSLSPGTGEAMILDAFATGRFPISLHGHTTNGNAGHEKTLAYLEVLPR